MKLLGAFTCNMGIYDQTTQQHLVPFKPAECLMKAPVMLIKVETGLIVSLGVPTTPSLLSEQICFSLKALLIKLRLQDSLFDRVCEHLCTHLLFLAALSDGLCPSAVLQTSPHFSQTLWPVCSLYLPHAALTPNAIALPEDCGDTRRISTARLSTPGLKLPIQKWVKHGIKD